MKKLVTILMVCVILTLAGCGSSSTKQVTLEGKRFNTEKFTDLPEETQRLVQGYINSALFLYQNTDINEPIGLGFYTEVNEGDVMSPNDYYNELRNTDEMNNYGVAIYNNQEPDERDRKVREHLMPIVYTSAAYNDIFHKMWDMESSEYNVSKSEWKAVEKALQEAIDYYYIDE